MGDVHGRLDLLRAMVARIEADAAARGRATSHLVMLGDVIDRGPDSKGVIEYLRTGLPPSLTPVFLMGNHEEMLLRILAGDADVIDRWIAHGGYECAQSYDVEVGRFALIGVRERLGLLRDRIPTEHVAFLNGFADTFRFGDYLFVHAGVRAGTPLEYQSAQDLRWIREDFLNSAADHGAVIVHGHSIVDVAEVYTNRIAIDTGAYASGRLTALVVDATHRAFLEVTLPVVAEP